MLRIVKYAIVTNIALSLLYFLSSLFLWTDINQWTAWNIASVWSPILITAYRIPEAPTVQMPIGPAYNIPFMLFCVMFAVNLYFILKIAKSKST
ncbi:MAG: hypothetical protein ACQCN4_08805 [Candidatus Bathyarchaeia archaeon]|jgi:hypothetical protein